MGRSCLTSRRRPSLGGLLAPLRRGSGGGADGVNSLFTGVPWAPSVPGTEVCAVCRQRWHARCGGAPERVSVAYEGNFRFGTPGVGTLAASDDSLKHCNVLNSRVCIYIYIKKKDVPELITK